MRINRKYLILAFYTIMSFPISISANEWSINDGIELFEAKNYKEARQYFTQIVKEKPDYIQGYYYLGRTNLKNRNFESAEKNFKTCIEKSPNTPEYHSWLGVTYLAMVDDANIFSKMSIGTKAKESLEKSIALEPNHVHGLINLGKFYLGAPSFAGGSVDKATEIAKKLLTINELEGRILLLHVYLSNEQFNKAELEFSYLSIKLEKSSEHATFYNTYGYYLLNKKEYDNAITQFEKQVHLIPDSVNAFDSLGDGYYAAQRFNKAKKAYQAALKLDPDFSHSKKYLKKINKQLNSRD